MKVLLKYGMCCAAVCAAWLATAQVPQTATTPLRSSQNTTIRAESNLVLVPAFVYPTGALARQLNPTETQCYIEDSSTFFALSAERAFFPRACEEELQDLRLSDFELLQDGEPQKIRTLEKENWWLCVRDNRTWHVETSIAPNGMWSSADIGRSLFPQTSTFYVLGYEPTPPKAGCHRLRVNILRRGVQVFARDEYCSDQTPSDLLNGTNLGKKLVRELDQKGHSKLALSLQAGTLRGTGKPIVDTVIEFPWSQLNHTWDEQTGRLRAGVGVLGAVYTKDGKLVSRFSDLLWPAYWPTILKGWQGRFGYLYGLSLGQGKLDTVNSLLSRWDPAWLPSRYETQFELPPGEYDLHVVLSDGEKYGKVEMPLIVENYEANSLALGSIFLCDRFRDAHVAAEEMAAANFAPQYVPLVSKGARVTPSGDTRFSPDTHLSAYFEIYQPRGTADPAQRIQAQLRIVDAKNGQIVKDFPSVDAAAYAEPGKTTIPMAREIPIATLSKGSYRLEVQASDSTGRSTSWHSASFTITDKR